MFAMLSGLAVVVFACAPDERNAADGVQFEEAAVLTSAELIAIANVLQDAQERVVPQLGNGPGARALAADLDRVAGALGATEPRDIMDAAARATRTLTALRADSAVADKLEGIHLVLRHVHALAASRIRK